MEVMLFVSRHKSIRIALVLQYQGIKATLAHISMEI